MLEINSIINMHILALLNIKSRHGYELIKELERTLGKNISTSQIYPFLSTLKKNKLIIIAKTGDRDKKAYLLTKEGEKFVKELFSRYDDIMNVALKNKLITCAHCGCKVYSGEFTTKVKNKILHFCCCHCAESFKKQNHQH